MVKIKVHKEKQRIMKKLLTIVLILLCFVSKAQKAKVHKENTLVRVDDTILYEHVAHIVPHQVFILPHDAYIYRIAPSKPKEQSHQLWIERRSGQQYNQYNEPRTFLDTGILYQTKAGAATKLITPFRHFADAKVSSQDATFDLYYLTFYKCKDGEQGDEFPKDGSTITTLDTQLYVHHVHVDSGCGSTLPPNSYLYKIVAKPSKKDGKNTISKVFADGHTEVGFNGGMIPYFTEDSHAGPVVFVWGMQSDICLAVKTSYGSMDVYYLTFEPNPTKAEIVKPN